MAARQRTNRKSQSGYIATLSGATSQYHFLSGKDAIRNTSPGRTVALSACIGWLGWSEHGIVRSSRCHSQPVISYSFTFVICKEKARSTLEGKIEEVLLLVHVMLPWMIDDAGRRPFQMSLIEWPWPPSKPAAWCVVHDAGDARCEMWDASLRQASKLSALPLLAHFSRYSLPIPPHHQLTIYHACLSKQEEYWNSSRLGDFCYSMFDHVPAHSLVFLRVAWGLVMLSEVYIFMVDDYKLTKERLVKPKFLFKYTYFKWIPRA